MENWKSTILSPDSKIIQAINVLNQEISKIILVCDESDYLIGTVTDGDIRRALIKNILIDSKLKKIMSMNPIVASTEDSQERILSMMQSEGILQIPIVDKDRRVVGLETFQNIFECDKHDNPVFLMAGGLGKRLRPLTDDTPKPLLKIGGTPILETIINQLIKFGFHNFFISTHYKSDMIRSHFGDGSRWNVNIQYIHEEKPLGTAGALGLLPKELVDLPILVMNGDLLTKVNFESLLDFHNSQDGVATICVREYDFQVPYGVIDIENDKVIGINEKPIFKFFINAGIYILNQEICRAIDGFNYLDMTSFLEQYINKDQKINTFPIYEYWIDIGHMDEFKKANKEACSLFLDDK